MLETTSGGKCYNCFQRGGDKAIKGIHDAKLLIVDDEPGIRKMLLTLLSDEGYSNIETAATASEAMEKLRLARPDAIILDVMLPGSDGFQLYEEIRTLSDAPVLFLSARDEDAARLRGLGLGADDYITKPFLPKELMLRLAAVLRRTYGSEDMALLHLGAVTVDFSGGTVSRNGQEKMLTAKEFSLLKKLAENRGRIVTIDSLCLAAWNEENLGYENTLMVHMRRLREKIEPDPSHPKYLITVRGLGYRLLKEREQ